MTLNARLPEILSIFSGFVPVDLSGGANAGDWVSLAGYDGCTVVLFKAAGTAGDDPTLTITQATDNAGTGEKALDIPAVYIKSGTLGDGGAGSVWNKFEAGDAGGPTDNTYTNLLSAEAQSIWAVHYHAEELDVANGFTHIQGSVNDVGTNAQLGCLFYLMSGPRNLGAEKMADAND